MQSSVPAWIVSGVLGLAIGVGGALLVTELTKPDPRPTQTLEELQQQIEQTQGLVAGFSSPPPPSPAQRLAARILEIDLLQSGLRLDLSSEQLGEIARLLEALEAGDVDRQAAETTLGAIDAVITDQQRERLALVNVTAPGEGTRPPPGESPPDPFADATVRAAIQRVLSAAESALGGGSQ